MTLPDSDTWFVSYKTLAWLRPVLESIQARYGVEIRSDIHIPHDPRQAYAFKDGEWVATIVFEGGVTKDLT